VAQFGLPTAYGVPALQLAVAQWSDCAIMPGGASVGDPAGPWPDLCGYAMRVADPPFDLPTLQVCSRCSTAVAVPVGSACCC